MDEANLISASESNLSGTLMLSSSPDPTSDQSGAMVVTTTAVTYKPASQPVPSDGSFYIAAYTTGPQISQRSVTTAPGGGGSQTEARLLDGRTVISAGNLAPAIQYAYSANATGEVTTASYIDRALNDPGNSNRARETVITQSDWAGRTLRMDYMDGSYSTMDARNNKCRILIKFC
jgi:hypothetical protein